MLLIVLLYMALVVLLLTALLMRQEFRMCYSMAKCMLCVALLVFIFLVFQFPSAQFIGKLLAIVTLLFAIGLSMMQDIKSQNT